MKEAQATIRIEFPSDKRAKVVWEALKPETEVSRCRRSQVVAEHEGRSLILSFKARDTTSLRASVNSFARWVVAIDEILSKADSLKPENREFKK